MPLWTLRLPPPGWWLQTHHLDHVPLDFCCHPSVWLSLNATGWVIYKEQEFISRHSGGKKPAPRDRVTPPPNTIALRIMFPARGLWNRHTAMPSCSGDRELVPRDSEH